MATISGCQSITAWLEDSPVISDTALWHRALLAIHSHHPAIIITSDTIINRASSWPCAACLTPTHTNKRGGGTQTHSKTPGDIVKKEQNPKAKSHKIYHQRKHQSQTLMFHPSQPSARQKPLMSRGEKVKIRQTSPARSPQI